MVESVVLEAVPEPEPAVEVVDESNVEPVMDEPDVVLSLDDTLLLAPPEAALRFARSSRCRRFRCRRRRMAWMWSTSRSPMHQHASQSTQL